MQNFFEDTICAAATPAGAGGIAVIRISGTVALDVADRITDVSAVSTVPQSSFVPRRVYYKEVYNSDGSLLDNVLLTYFKTPYSYTGEDVVEISCHASPYIVRTILSLCLAAGARIARAGEFTQRAFLNGKLDLSQAEAVADVIASENAASHRLAIMGLRGGVSAEISMLRSELLNLTSLLELELDFGEEDVEFASRSELRKLLEKIALHANTLRNSFALGNAIKEGIPVAIIGKPNAGKSTLLNALLGDEKALVSEVAGTTRDAIEDTVIINGIKFRFIDTAGLRNSDDIVERMGVERTLSKMRQASIWLYVFDITDISLEQAYSEVAALKPNVDAASADAASVPQVIFIGNKIDKLSEQQLSVLHNNSLMPASNNIFLSAISAQSSQLDCLREALIELSGANAVSQNQVILTNARHYEILGKVMDGLSQIKTEIESGLSADLLSQQLRTVLDCLGEITGQITTDDVLANIFSRFCIGK
ncbi:MAG: tRNA uridine-5-carboxymethylaminomethyl(34) synthesis GTPase MnmE [Bacteroidales bacterium]|nr:tRNA uridine-5-carboxymethylaminomethyl(34) synthesis GTPase MnmE [Bacteroidales bacterium]